MKHIISYSLFESNESGNPLEDLQYLHTLGVLNPQQFWDEIETAIKNKRVSPDQLARLEPSFEFDYVDAGGIWEAGYLEKILQDWRGPGGVKILRATGKLSDEGIEMSLFLSNADKIEFNEDWVEYSGLSVWIERNGRRSSIPDLDNFISKLYDNLTDSSYYHKIFNALVDSASSADGLSKPIHESVSEEDIWYLYDLGTIDKEQLAAGLADLGIDSNYLLEINLSFDWANRWSPEETQDELKSSLNSTFGKDIIITDVTADGGFEDGTEWTDSISSMDLEEGDPYSFSGEVTVNFFSKLPQSTIEDLLRGDYIVDSMDEGDGFYLTLLRPNK